MRVEIVAVGRMKASPEAELVKDYLDRFAASAKNRGIASVSLTEIDDRKARHQQAQSQAVLAACSTSTHLIALDERGTALKSEAFAAQIAKLAEQGVSHLAFALGGADGHSQILRDRAQSLLSFGPMVWPHMLARVMLAEQLYRASQILTGTPYHRA